jgi:hypothetical protein
MILIIIDMNDDDRTAGPAVLKRAAQTSYGMADQAGPHSDASRRLGRRGRLGHDGMPVTVTQLQYANV